MGILWAHTGAIGCIVLTLIHRSTFQGTCIIQGKLSPGVVLYRLGGLDGSSLQGQDSLYCCVYVHVGQVTNTQIC